MALVVAGVTSTDPPAQQRRVADPRAAPDFRLPSLADPTTEIELTDFRGHPLVINFWASWCVPCRKEMPAFQAVYARLKGRVGFIGVNHADTRRDALDFVRTTHVRYPIAFDPDGTTAAAYGLFGVPTTVFLDSHGRELERDTGQITRDQLEKTIKRLFPRRPPTTKAVQ